jgi:hypothetical protein
MAAGVVALSLLAYLWRGWPAGLATGAALALHHQIYELSHYMKEDSALLMGVAFTFLAAVAYAQVPSNLRALILGVSAGLAISGKYLGVVVLAVAIPAVWLHSEAQRQRRLAFFVAGLVALILLVNLPLFLHPEVFRQSFRHEMVRVIEGQDDATHRVPHTLYWNIFVDDSSPLIWLLLLTFLIVRWGRRGGLLMVQRLIVLFPFAYALLLSFSPKVNDRYFLPATAIFVLIACLGTMDAPRVVQAIWKVFGLPHPERALAGRWRRSAIAVAILALVIMEFTGWSAGKPGWFTYDQAFQRDDKAELITWMKANLPKEAKVAADLGAGLVDQNPRKDKPGALLEAQLQNLPQKLLVSKYAADIGTIDQLRAQGVSYVVVSENSYGRYFRTGVQVKEEKGGKFANDRAFYEALFREEPLFERERRTVIYLHPGIRVYRIPATPAD